MSILDKIARFYKFPLVDSKVKVVLTVDGQDFELEQFKIGFSKAIDEKGEPENDIKGGQFIVTFAQTLPDNLYRWIMGVGVRKNGIVAFINEQTNAPLRVEFFDAACVNLVRSINSSGGLYTNIAISPRRVVINGVEHENPWTL